MTACAKEVAKLLQLTDSMLKLLTLSDPSKSAADLLKLYVPTDTGAQTREATQLYSVYLQELVKREGKVAAKSPKPHLPKESFLCKREHPLMQFTPPFFAI